MKKGFVKRCISLIFYLETIFITPSNETFMTNIKTLSLSLLASSLLLASCGGDGAQKRETSTSEAQEVAAVTDAEAVTLAIDPAQSLVNWEGTKAVVETKHVGSLNFTSGEVTGNAATKKILGGKFTIDMASLVNFDQKGDMKTMLEDHLKSKDFFEVETYPTSVFEITSAEQLPEEGRFKVSGNLTIKGKTNNIEFLATVRDDGTKYTAITDTITIDRTKWDIIYGSGQGLKELTDNVISDQISFVATVVAGK